MPKRAFSGGSRQVARQAGIFVQAAESVGGEGGNLASLLLEKRAWGDIPSTLVQEIAAAAVADGATCARLLQLSLLGTEGVHSNNVHRDLAISFHLCF
jgi:hypothetical protein